MKDFVSKFYLENIPTVNDAENEQGDIFITTTGNIHYVDMTEFVQHNMP